MTFLKIIHPLGLVSWNMVLPKFVSLWQSISRRHMIWLVSLITRRWIMVSWIAGSEMDYTNGASNIQYFYNINIAYRLHICPPFRPRTSRARVLFFNDVHCRPVASARESWPRRSTPRHGAPSPSFVLRLPWADRRFLLLPAAEPMTYSGRPPRPRPHRRSFSAVHSRDVSAILTHSERPSFK